MNGHEKNKNNSNDGNNDNYKYNIPLLLYSTHLPTGFKQWDKDRIII